MSSMAAMAAEQSTQGYRNRDLARTPAGGWSRRSASCYARTRGDRAPGPSTQGVGEGGDRSLVIDRQAEEIVFVELERLHAEGAEFTAISEERGEVVFGDAEVPSRVVIDPIDGSLNARRTLPSFALSVAVASGPSMADVELGLRPRLRHRGGVRRGARARRRPSTARSCSPGAPATGSRWSGSRRPSRS